MLSFSPQAILFDAYGTLVYLDRPFERMQEALRWRGVELPLEPVTKALRAEMRYYRRENRRGHNPASLDALRLDCAGVILDAFSGQGISLSLSPSEMVECILESFVFMLYPEVPEAMERISRWGIPMGVVSNWDYRLPSILENLGVAHCFKVILASATAGVEKPDPRIFQMALEGLQIPAKTALFIGDSLENDIAGAQAVGLYPILLVREGSVSSSVPVARNLLEALCWEAGHVKRNPATMREL